MRELNYKGKIALIGDSGVGKHTLAQPMVHDLGNEFHNFLGLTIACYDVRAQGKEDAINAKLVLWDITGTLKAGKLRDNYEEGVRGLIAVADASRIDTVHNIDHWLEAMREKFGDLDTVLVLNKIDLVKDSELEVVESLMSKYAEKYNSPLILTSGAEKMNIQEPFIELGKKICSKFVGEVGSIEMKDPPNQKQG